MGTAPPSKVVVIPLSEAMAVPPRKRHRSPFARNSKRRIAFSKKKQANKKNHETSLMQCIASRDWQKALIRASMCPSEITSFYRMKLYGVEWDLLPIHLACALNPPMQIVESLLPKDVKEKIAAVPMTRTGRTQNQPVAVGAAPTDLFSDCQQARAVHTNYSVIVRLRRSLSSLRRTKKDRNSDESVCSGRTEKCNNQSWSRPPYETLPDEINLWQEPPKSSLPIIQPAETRKPPDQGTLSNEPASPSSNSSSDDEDISVSSLEQFLGHESAFLQLSNMGLIRVAKMQLGLENTKSAFPGSSRQQKNTENSTSTSSTRHSTSIHKYPTQQARIRPPPNPPSSPAPDASLPDSKSPINAADILQDADNLLPINIACLYRARPEVLGLLLDAYTRGAQESTFFGMLPIHMVCAGITISNPPVLIKKQHEEMSFDDESKGILLRTIEVLLKSYPASQYSCSKRDGLTPLEYFFAGEHEDDEAYELCLEKLGRSSIADHSVGSESVSCSPNLAPPSVTSDCVSEISEHETPSVAEQTIVEAPSDELDDSTASSDSIREENALAPNAPEHVPSIVKYPDFSFLMSCGNRDAAMLDEGTSVASSGLMVTDDDLNFVDEAQAVDSAELHTVLMAKDWERCMKILADDPDQAQQWLFGVGTNIYEAADDLLWRRLPIHNACALDAPIVLIRALVDAYPESVRRPDPYNGLLPLHIACQSGFKSSQEETVSFLLSGYPDAVKSQDWQGRLPLHFACLGGADMAVIKILVTPYPEALQRVDDMRNTPVDYAKGRMSNEQDFSSQQVVEFLEKAATDRLSFGRFSPLEGFLSIGENICTVVSCKDGKETVNEECSVTDPTPYDLLLQVDDIAV